MNETIRSILTAHGRYNQFLEAGSCKPGSIWNVTIVPVEGSTTFSTPLIIAREANYVRCAHFHVSTYDVEYNPLVEFEINTLDETWTPLTIYWFHTGLKTVGKDISREDADEFVSRWSKDLIDRKYHHIEFAKVLDSSHGIYQSHL